MNKTQAKSQCLKDIEVLKKKNTSPSERYAALERIYTTLDELDLNYEDSGAIYRANILAEHFLNTRTAVSLILKRGHLALLGRSEHLKRLQVKISDNKNAQTVKIRELNADVENNKRKLQEYNWKGSPRE
jgi:hypothetical protein